MPSEWRRPALSAGLLLVTLIVVAAGLGLLGGLVFLPQLGAVGWVAIGALLFLGVQLLMFRVFGLRSRADDEAKKAEQAEEPAEKEDSGESKSDGDWRAWRG
jgi:hypothetical protein